NPAPLGVRVGTEVELAPTAIADVRVDLGGRRVGKKKNLLDATEIGAALQQVRGERMPEQVRVDPPRLEARLLRQAAQDQEHACARQATALSVEEELRPMPPIEMRPSARDVAPERVGRGPAERHDSLLRAL